MKLGLFPKKPMAKKLQTITKTKISPKIVAGVVIIIGLAGLSFIGASLLGTAGTSTQTAATKTCLTAYDCQGIICPQVIGGDKTKCDLKTKTCYCGGICGDGYCDSIEKRDSSCPADCNRCSDGTLFGKCSLNKPKYCSNGSLVNKCSPCGCPPNFLCQADGSCKPIEAYFKFNYPPRPETFIFKLTDPVKIQKARDIISGKITDTIHVMGKIIKKPANYNPAWGYYLDPNSISFFQTAMEICDANILYVQNHLSEACGSFLPNCIWCPWGSRLIGEVKL